MNRLERWLEIPADSAAATSADADDSGQQGATGSSAQDDNVPIDEAMDIEIEYECTGPPGALQTSPQFPLLPLSKGFRISLIKQLKHLRTSLESLAYIPPSPSTQSDS